MNRSDYEARMNDVTAYIFDHLQDDLDLDRLADVAGLSAFHWHRIYRSLRGETVAATVKRLRMQRAASLLAESTLPVTTIARRCGFDHVASFSRAFAEIHGMPPGRYRREGEHVAFRDPAADAGTAHVVEIRHLEAVHLAMMPHTGAYTTIGRTFTIAWDRTHAAGCTPHPVRMIAIYDDDPDAVPVRLLRSRAGLVVPAGVTVPGLLPVTIPAGRHAILRYRGPYGSMHAAYRWFFGPWLTTSGETPRHHPVFEDYLDDPATVHPNDLRTDILMPLA